MGGILQQTAKSVATLLGAASSGADPVSLRTGFGALNDQLDIAARDAFEPRGLGVAGRHVGRVQDGDVCARCPPRRW